jgi:cytoskeletal protein CcmA (bactofilin family)
MRYFHAACKEPDINRAVWYTGFMKNRITGVILFIILIIGLLSDPTARPQALELKTGETVTLTGSHSTGNVAAAGTTITVNRQVINGDLYCAGQTVTVNADVNGDLLCFAQTLIVNGKVSGSVRAFTLDLTENNTVGRNMTVVTQNLTVTKNAKIAGETIVSGDTVKIDGTAGSITASTQSLSVNQIVNGDISADTDTLSVGPKASVSGSLSYTAVTAASISESAQIAGNVTSHITGTAQAKPMTIGPAKWGITMPRNNIGSLLIYLGLGLLLVLMIPKRTVRILEIMKTRFWGMVGTGLTAVILASAAAIILLFTVIGIPVSILLFILIPVCILLARLLAAVAVGNLALGYVNKQIADNLILDAAAGVAITWAVFGIPIVGPFITVISALWGLGGLIQTYRKPPPIKT